MSSGEAQQTLLMTVPARLLMPDVFTSSMALA